MTEGTANLDARADSAASEAAREARAEVYEREQKKSKKSKKSKADKVSRISARASKSKDGWHRFVVDVWLTDLNPTEFGIYKRSRNRAKSRQFTSDMDIYAEIIENGERTGLLGYRKDLWKDNKGMNRRLVFKMFSDKLNWRATMDLMVGRSLQQTLGARGVPAMTYSINTNDDDFMIYLERSAYKIPLIPEQFSFFLIQDGKPEFYYLKRSWINIGGDYKLFNQKGERIGWVDGKILSLAGKWRCAIKSEYASKKMLTTLKLFAGMIIFNRQARWHMWRLRKDIRAGRVTPKLERQESDLYMNPRRVR